MEIDQLNLFVAVARLNSMTKASQLMHVTQSAISQSVARLESELGVRLFERTGRCIQLNEAGGFLYQRISGILNDLDNTKLELLRYQKEINDRLRLQILAGSALIPDLLSQFNKLYPGVRFQLIQQKNGSDYDLCINYMPSDSIMNNADILLTEEIYLAVPKNHLFAKKKSVMLNEAANENFIMMRQGSALRDLADRICHEAGFQPKIVFESDSPATVRELMRLGLGAAFLPFITWNTILDDQIKALHIDAPQCSRTLYIYSPKERHETEAMLAFKRFAKHYFMKIQREVDEKYMNKPASEMA